METLIAIAVLLAPLAVYCYLDAVRELSKRIKK